MTQETPSRTLHGSALSRRALAALVAVLASWAVPLLAVGPENVFVQGAPLPGAFGLRFGPDGMLYVASFGPGVVVLHPETGQMIGLLGPEQGVVGPEDVGFGPDGSLYWSEMFTGNVGRRAPDGAVTHQMVAPGVNPFAFSAGGRLFTTVCWWGDVLLELDPTFAAPPRPVLENLGWLKGLEFGPDGKLYGASVLGGQVVRIDVAATPPTVEPVATGFAAPFTAKFDSTGKMIVNDRPLGNLYRVDPADGSRELIAHLDFGIDNVAIGPGDRLFVSSYSDGIIAEVLAGGTLRMLLPGGLIMPSAPAVMARPDGESLWVPNMLGMREYDTATGALRSTLRYMFMPPPAFGGASTAAAAGDRLVTAMFFPAPAVQVLDAATGAVVEDYRDFNMPINAIGFQGDMVVIELGTAAGEAKVTRAGAAGRTTLADATMNIFVPVGLAATADDLWVSDWASGMVWQLVADGVELAPPRPVATGLEGPEGMAVDRDGSLLVVEATAKRLSRIDPITGAVRPIASGLALGMAGFGIMPPFGFVNGVAVGGDGALYVTAELANAVYRLVPRTSYVAAAAHRSGYGGSAWSTELGVHNPNTVQATYVVELLETGKPNPAPAAASFTLDGGKSARYADALDSLFAFTGTGALRVTSYDGDLRVTACTANAKGGRWMGQLVEGQAEGDAIVAGQEARLVHLTNSGSRRTNIGAVNAAGVPIEIAVSLFQGDGSAIGETVLSLPPFGHLQENDVFHHLATLAVSAASLDTIDDAYALVKSDTAGARYFAYASVVDNASGSPIHIPAR
jgi:streptogramin lyase